MIPLAQYLTEFEDEGSTPFERSQAGRGARSRRASDGQPASFEAAFDHLPVVGDGNAQESSTEAGAAASPFAELSELDDEPTAGFSMPHSASNENAPSQVGEAVDVGQPAAPSEADFERLIAEAADAARSEATAEAKVAADAALAEAVAAARAEERETAEREKAEAVEAARAEWTSGEAVRIADLITERLGHVEDLVKAMLGHVLKPVVLDARRRQSMDDLTDAARLLIGDGQALSLTVSGPSNLLDALSLRLKERARFVTFEPDETQADVRIECGETVVESRLEEWRAALEEALA